MYGVQCANCGRRLTIPKPIVRGKIRCPACGTVFVGTARPLGGSPSGAPAGGEADSFQRPLAPDDTDGMAARVPISRPPLVPDLIEEPAAAEGPPPAAVRAARSVARPVPSRKALYLGLLMGGLAVFLVAFVVLMAKYAGTVHFEERDSYGRLIDSGRISQEEAQRRRQKAKEEPVVIVKQEPSPAATAQPDPTNPANPRVSLAGLTPSSQPAEGQAAPSLPEVPALPEDPKVRSVSFEKYPFPGSTDAGLITGLVASEYALPLRELRLTVQVVDPSGRVVATLPAYLCQYVPAGGTARYSVEFSGVPEDSIGRVRISARAVPMGKGEVSYDAEVNPALDYQEQAVVVTGTARNGGLKAIGGAFVHCEFYTREWKFVQAARGELEEEAGGRLGPGRRARFRAELPLGEPDPSRSIRQVVARVVGKEE